MFKSILIIIFLSTISTQAYSNDKRVILGACECATWTKYSNEEIKNNRANIMSSTCGGWISGFLSGTNLYEKKDILSAIDHETIIRWVDRYCNQNPERNILDAGIKLQNELLKIKK